MTAADRHLGYTGTQEGMNPSQFKRLSVLMEEMRADFDVFHHGDCIGADEQAHNLARWLDYRIVVHPPSSNHKRANVHLWMPDVEMLKPLPYLRRNRMIVLTTAHLIVCPRQAHEVTRSGTWSTKRFAEKLERPITIVYP